MVNIGRDAAGPGLGKSINRSAAGGNMPVPIVLASSLPMPIGGAIVGWSKTWTHNFPSSTVWAHGTFQAFSVSGNGADINVISFTDGNVVHNGVHTAHYGENCTSVTYEVDVGISEATALLITQRLQA
jgi:hypothetical protein